MRRLFICLVFTCSLFSTSLYSQKLMDSVTSSLLKMKMPVGTVRQRSADSIRMTTALLDSFTVLKDYSLNKYTTESFYIPTFDSLKARLDRNNFTITRYSGTDFYAIKKDSFNYIARVSTIDQQTMVSMKPMTVSKSSQPFAEVNKIVASDRINNVEFGRAVSISNNYAVVGAQIEDMDADGKNPITDAGAAYVYERGPGNKWKQVQKIVAADREGYNYFGTSIGIDGDIIVVGAPGHSRDSTERQEGYVGDAGAVFVFERKGNNWRRTYKLLASDREHGGAMGNSVGISGNLVIAGAWAQDFGMNGENRMEAAGAAYIWERMEDGKWTKAQKLIASDRTPYDEFGYSVAIDGDNAVVGARRVTLKPTDENNDAYSGEAYIFSRNENGKWKEVKAIIPDDRKTGDYFGSSVGVSGNYAIVGSWRGDTKKPDIGVIYIYWKNPAGKWIQSQKISASDEGTYSNFSVASAIHKGFIISGSPMEWRDVAGKNELSNAGAAYIFMRGDDQSKGKANPVTPKQVPKAPTNKTQ